MKKDIEGMLSAEDAAKEFVRYAELVANSAVKSNIHIFKMQRVGLHALLSLLEQYAEQKE